MSDSESPIVFRHPESTDGLAVHRLIEACPPLDTNSLSYNLLQVSHFGATACVALIDGEIAGSVTGYVPPAQPDTYFLWQVAVGEKARGRRLGRRMIAWLFAQPALADLRFLETTITEDNIASWKLFRGYAEQVRAPVEAEPLFERDRHFGGSHDTEMLVRIGPFGTLERARGDADAA